MSRGVEVRPCTQIANAHEKLETLLREFVKRPERDDGIEIIEARQYASRLRKDLRRCYTNNMEQQMWRHCFYGPVETLKCSGEAARALLLDLFTEAIRFYEEELISDYETTFDVDFNRVLFWPITGFPSENLSTCLPMPQKNSLLKSSAPDEVVLRSAQRLFLSVGDLYRYRGKMMRSGSDMDSAKSWYLKAAQLNFSNGRCYNQVAVAIVAATNRLDQAYFFMMAIAAKHPFPAAKESLESALLNEIREIVSAEEDAREKQLRHQRDKEAKLKAKTEKNREKRAGLTEIWIRPGEGHYSPHRKGGGTFKDLEKGSSEDADETSESSVDAEVSECGDPVTRWAESTFVQFQQQILYILHVAGTLMSRVGIDKLAPVSQRVISTLPELVASDGVTALGFVKISLILIFVLHRCGEGASSQAVANLQRDLALHITLALFEALLDLLMNSADTLGLFLMVGKLSKKIQIERILPAICLLSAWIQLPTAQELLTSTNDGDVSAVRRQLFTLMSKAQIVLGVHSIHAASTTSGKFPIHCPFKKRPDCPIISVLLPELVLATVLHGVFPPDPLPISSKGDNLERAAIVGRLSVIVEAGSVLQQKFGSEIEAINPSTDGRACIGLDSNSVDGNVEQEEEEEDEERLKQRLIEEEHSSSSHEWVVEVRPQYVVADTNTFVDHLQELKAILDSKDYTLLVPTIVLTELSSLSLGDFATRTAACAFLLPGGCGSGNTQQKYVEANARETVRFLREESEKRNPHLLSVTSNGNILPRFSFACETNDYGDRKTNDDRILAACVALSERQPQSATKLGDNKTLIKRSVVFLTEDRALTVKTLAAKIPVKTVPAFMKWAGLGKRANKPKR